MGLFDLFKKDNSEPTWIVYQDEIEGHKMSVRVDTQFVKKQFLHTYYIRVKYCEEDTNELPDSSFLEKVSLIEDNALDILEKICGNKVAYLGCATFGGSSYLTFASDYDIRWSDMLDAKLSYKVESGAYKGDRMGYYNQILYPDYMRKETKH